MRTNTILVVAFGFLLFGSRVSYCESGLSYHDTVTSIKETMSNKTSSYRQESYDYIRFDRCTLEYRVQGRYPVGDTYNIRYSNIDISSLNPDLSKTSHDYTAFLILNFERNADYDTGSDRVKVRTVVINASDDQATEKLLQAFLHLKKLCSTGSPSGITE